LARREFEALYQNTVRREELPAVSATEVTKNGIAISGCEEARMRRSFERGLTLACEEGR
jgi:NOL1/NOP2/fmu family ribosome biogenesis protein